VTQPSGTRYTLPWSDDRPRLGRHVNHDPRSLRYPHPVLPRSAIASQHWTRRCPVLDQGDLGSCTGQAAAGWIGTDNTIRQGRADVTEDLAVQLYEAATRLDSFDGEYPPTDSGSDGVSVTKALQRAGYVTAYTHGFSLRALDTALQVGPALIGIPWYQSQFDPASDGRIRVDTTSGLAGGHELIVDQVVATTAGVVTQYWVTNSWSQDWGVGGRGYFTAADLATLLADDGDVTVPAALTAPGPSPAPVDADATFAAALHPWVATHHIGANGRAAAAARTWLAAKDL
jgi:hypothetical protein